MSLALIDNSLELELKRAIFTESYYEFFKWAFNILFPNEKYEDAFHVKELCDMYQAEIERIIRKEEKTTDIIVNIPPRTSKSLITSVCLLPWMWIKDPTLPMISVSFDEELSLLNAQYSKDIIKSDDFQSLFGDKFYIRPDADSKGYFMNDKGGFRLSKTTGANITGHKGIVIIVDDPQNPKTAESEVHRKNTIDYYTRSLYNRLTPANLGVRIIIMQRLHEDDLTGYLLKNDPNGEQYRHICLPATKSALVKPAYLTKRYTFVGNDKDGKPVEVLDPVRLGLKVLTDFKKTLGTRGYTGQYDQRPAPEEGGILKKHWFEIVQSGTLRRDTVNEPIHFFIDSAYTEKTENDPTSIKAAFKSNNFLYILDVQEVWLEFPKLIEFIKKYVVQCGYSQNSKIFIEPKASGKSIVQQLRATTQFTTIETKAPDNDKITRAHGISPTCEGGRVKLIQGVWNEKFLEQVGQFPNASHDDQVDTLVMAVNELLVNDNPDLLWL